MSIYSVRTISISKIFADLTYHWSECRCPNLSLWCAQIAPLKTHSMRSSARGADTHSRSSAPYAAKLMIPVPGSVTTVVRKLELQRTTSRKLHSRHYDKLPQMVFKKKSDWQCHKSKTSASRSPSCLSISLVPHLKQKKWIRRNGRKSSPEPIAN